MLLPLLLSVQAPMAAAGSAAELALDLMNKAAGQFPAQQLSAFLETAQLSAFLETATDSDGTGDWPMEVFLFDLVCSTLILTFGYFWLKTPTMPKKRLSWVLSALTSMTCATLSMYHVHKLYKHDWDCGSIFFTDDRLSRFTVTFFVAFLLLDLFLGTMHYREFIRVDSGWVHHIFYLGVLAWALHSHFTVAFCCFLPLELPSFILALGTIYPEYRSDIGFGATFLITRLVYHSLLLFFMLQIKNPRLTIWPIAAIALVMHCYWFSAWVRSYRKRGSKDGKRA